MEQLLLEYLHEYRSAAFLISLFVSIAVAVLGVVPSVFVTGANLMFFGVVMGTLISFAGEALGAIIAFFLYRKGFKDLAQQKLSQYSRVNRLLELGGKEAFYAILSLRLLPFIPSGLVTMAGAIGRVSLPVFAVASSLGKLPALVIEAYSVYQVTQWNGQGKFIMGAGAVYLLYVVLKKQHKSPKKEEERS